MRSVSYFVAREHVAPLCELWIGVGDYAALGGDGVLRLSAGRADLVALLAGLLIALLADVQLECCKDAAERSRHRGWRAPSPIPGRGPRLVYSSERRSDGARTPTNDRGTNRIA